MFWRAQLVLSSLLLASYCFSAKAAVVSPVTNGLIYAADATDVTLDGGEVASWTDQSSSGNHATQSTAGNRPVPSSVLTPLGTPTIAFDGSNDYLTIPSNPTDFDTGQYTFYGVFRTADSDNGRLVNSAYSDIDPSMEVKPNYSAWSGFVGSNERWRVNGRTPAGGANGTFVQVNSQNGALDYVNFFVAGGVIDNSTTNGDGINIVIDEGNNKLEVSDEGFDMVPTGHLFTNIGVGSSTTSDSPTAYFEGEMAELLIFNRALSASERAQVEEYLVRKHFIPEPTTGMLLILGVAAAGVYYRSKTNG